MRSRDETDTARRRDGQNTQVCVEWRASSWAVGGHATARSSSIKTNGTCIGIEGADRGAQASLQSGRRILSAKVALRRRALTIEAAKLIARFLCGSAPFFSPTLLPSCVRAGARACAARRPVERSTEELLRGLHHLHAGHRVRVPAHASRTGTECSTMVNGSSARGG
eukprot:6185308-Pleurochrysis_carterae.AAC.2